jgi:hypothetical protein
VVDSTLLHYRKADKSTTPFLIKLAPGLHSADYFRRRWFSVGLSAVANRRG